MCIILHKLFSKTFLIKIHAFSIFNKFLKQSVLNPGRRKQKANINAPPSIRPLSLLNYIQSLNHDRTITVVFKYINIKSHPTQKAPPKSTKTYNKLKPFKASYLTLEIFNSGLPFRNLQIELAASTVATRPYHFICFKNVIKGLLH